VAFKNDRLVVNYPQPSREFSSRCCHFFLAVSILPVIQKKMAINEYSEPSKMEGLTKKLASEVQTLEKLLRLGGHPVPSFNRDTPPTVVPNDAPESAHLAREQIMDYALQIFQLAAGPSDYLANLQTGVSFINSCI
jgi:hypothetical protein